LSAFRVSLTVLIMLSMSSHPLCFHGSVKSFEFDLLFSL
jgi:hypothetical protein